MENIIRIGIDTSKSVFQLHGVDASEKPVLVKRLSVADCFRSAGNCRGPGSGSRHVGARTTGREVSQRWGTRLFCCRRNTSKRMSVAASTMPPMRKRSAKP
jgi:hypothetical protein